MFQLQVIFAGLQMGIARVHNPQPLVKALRLETNEQQDAQESVAGIFRMSFDIDEGWIRFAKLFMHLLDDEFRKQDVPELKTLLTDLVGSPHLRNPNLTFLWNSLAAKSNTRLDVEVAAPSLVPQPTFLSLN